MSPFRLQSKLNEEREEHTNFDGVLILTRNLVTTQTDLPYPGPHQP